MIRQLRHLIERRQLIWYLTKSNLKVTYKNKALGYLWSLLDPLMMMLVYVVLVQVIFKRGEPLFPILLFSALLAWRWFLQTIQQSTLSIASKEKLVQTVGFPRIVLPAQHILTGLVKYGLSLGVLAPLLLVFRVPLTIHILWLPLIVLCQLVLTFGVAVYCSVVGVYFRDLQNILVFGLRLVFYLSPALYSIGDRVPERLQTLYLVLNPFAALFNGYKNALVRGEPPLLYLGIVLALGLALSLSSLAVFDKYEDRLAKDV
ncbi:ABC transporter permease [Candidatus Bipolaricaulota bacterium]